MLEKIGKVNDFSFIRKEPYYRDIFNQIQGYPPPPCLFIIYVIVYNLCYCCYAKTSSSAVQKRHSKVYGNPIAPSFYSISPWSRLYVHMYVYTVHNLPSNEPYFSVILKAYLLFNLFIHTHWHEIVFKGQWFLLSLLFIGTLCIRDVNDSVT